MHPGKETKEKCSEPEAKALAMELCDTCKSIDWEGLPAFPEDLYDRNATGLQHVHSLFAKGQDTGQQPTDRVKYHESFDALSQAATNGCGLCVLVMRQANALLTEMEGLEGIQKEMEGTPPTFDMWLTKRPEKGEGLWVLSEVKKDSERLSEFESSPTLLVAAIGFSAIEGSRLKLVK